jgi:hypothetical protein
MKKNEYFCLNFSFQPNWTINNSIIAKRHHLCSATCTTNFIPFRVIDQLKLENEPIVGILPLIFLLGGIT